MSFKCPKCGHAASDNLAPQRNNQHKTITLEIPEHLVSAVSRSLMIGGNAAMMSRYLGSSEMQDFLHGAAKEVATQIPWTAEIFDPNNWVAIADRLMKTGDIKFTAVNVGHSWRQEWRIQASAEKDENWPRAGQKSTGIHSNAFASEADAQECLDRLNQEAVRLSPM